MRSSRISPKCGMMSSGCVALLSMSCTLPCKHNYCAAKRGQHESCKHTFGSHGPFRTSATWGSPRRDPPHLQAQLLRPSMHACAAARCWAPSCCGPPLVVLAACGCNCEPAAPARTSVPEASFKHKSCKSTDSSSLVRKKQLKPNNKQAAISHFPALTSAAAWLA